MTVWCVYNYTCVCPFQQCDATAQGVGASVTPPGIIKLPHLIQEDYLALVLNNILTWTTMRLNSKYIITKNMYEFKSKSNCRGCGLRCCNVGYLRLCLLKIRSNQNKQMNRTHHDRRVPYFQLPILSLLSILWLVYFNFECLAAIERAVDVLHESSNGATNGGAWAAGSYTICWDSA